LQPFFLSFAVAKVETIFELANISDKNFAEILLRFLLYVVLFIDNQVYNDVLNFLYLLHFFYSSSLSSVVSRFFCSFVSRIET
jgi:hypothetical protein